MSAEPKEPAGYQNLTAKNMLEPATTAAAAAVASADSTGLHRRRRCVGVRGALSQKPAELLGTWNLPGPAAAAAAV
jgi:hypothetical protein